MCSRTLTVLVLVFACLGGGCRDETGPAALSTASSVSSSAATFPTAGSLPDAAVDALSEEEQECRRFTVGLDRFVFIRLQPVLAEAGELLGAPSGADEEETAAGLFEAARRLEGLVDELDRMGVPPREAVDLLLSVRRGVLLYAAGFEKGGRGRQSGDAGLIREAKAETLEAAAELNSYFGLQMCG